MIGSAKNEPYSEMLMFGQNIRQFYREIRVASSVEHNVHGFLLGLCPADMSSGDMSPSLGGGRDR